MAKSFEDFENKWHESGLGLHDGILGLLRTLAHDKKEGTIDAVTDDLAELFVQYEIASSDMRWVSAYLMMLAEKMEPKNTRTFEQALGEDFGIEA